MTSKTSPDDTSSPDGAARRADAAGPARRRRPYAAPHLEVLGDVRDLTLGPTPGVGDSTPPNTQPF